MVAFEEQGRWAGAARHDADAHNEIGQGSLASTIWRKSSWSACNGNCVEVAVLHHGLIGVRDSKEDGQGPVLTFHGAAWRSFIDSVKNGS